MFGDSDCRLCYYMRLVNNERFVLSVHLELIITVIQRHFLHKKGLN